MVDNLNTDLEDLLATFSEADRPTMRTLLTNNPAAQTRLASAATIYTAFVNNDQAALAAAAAQPAATTPVAQPSATQPAATPASQIGLGLDQISALLDARVNSLYTSPQFAAAVEERAKTIAKAQFEAERTQVIGHSAEISDEITTIRESHLREFSEPLDSAAFRTFYAAEGPKYGNALTATYNAFVNEKRIEKRIKDGVAAGLAAEATNRVAGGSADAPTTHNSLAPNFLDFNVQRIGTAAGTPAAAADADKAAQAFATMRSRWTQ